jgi:5-methylcytosine-specific restriction endonuclease McrA
MSNLIPKKKPRIREVPKLYARLRKEILEQDSWRCQEYGSSRHLDVHHMRRRSALGEDAETNLITLCRQCHQILHRSASRLPKAG